MPKIEWKSNENRMEIEWIVVEKKMGGEKSNFFTKLFGFRKRLYIIHYFQKIIAR